MPAVTLPGRRASVRAVHGKHASGPSRRNVPTGPGRCRRLRRSTSPLVSSAGGCTVEATVARYYDPSTAQFLTRDPLEAETGEPYSYAGDDPIDNGDPSGLFCLGDWCPSQSLQFAEGEVIGAGKFAWGTAQAVANPVGFAQGIGRACSSGYSSEGGGLDGALQCADNLDPFSGFVNAFSACSSEQAGEDFGGSLAATAATLAGGAEGDAPGSLGSTGRTTPMNITEQLAMEQAKSDPAAGTQLRLRMTDSRWPASAGWVKMAQNINGVEIHYLINSQSGAVDDFKFVG